MKIPHYIQQILQEVEITKTLEERGIYPSKTKENKIYYKCPIHEGDSNPSFIVFTDKTYQTYKCFGCHSGSNIINLISELDNVSIKQSIRYLIRGIKIDDKDILEDYIDDIVDYVYYESKDSINEISLKISRVCYDFLQSINFNDKEVFFFNGLFKIINKAVKQKNKNVLIKMLDFLLDEGIPDRIDIYIKKKEMEQLENINV